MTAPELAALNGRYSVVTPLRRLAAVQAHLGHPVSDRCALRSEVPRRRHLGTLCSGPSTPMALADGSPRDSGLRRPIAEGRTRLRFSRSRGAAHLPGVPDSGPLSPSLPRPTAAKPPRVADRPPKSALGVP